MSGEQVRVGVIGVGGMGSNHCKHVDDLEELELAAVVDINEDRAKQIGEQFDVPWFVHYRDLLGEEMVDAVTIATPHYFHPPIAVDSFHAGLHVLSEKPIGVRIGEAEKMAEAAEQTGKVFAVMFQMRTQANVQKAKEIVESGRLGPIRRTLLVSPEYRSQAYYDSGTWRATWGGEGGGVMMNQAPHIMDVFTMLGGLPKKVSGRCETALHEIEVEDQAQAMLEYEDGACGYFYVSTCEMGTRVVEFVGDRGKLRMEGGKLRLWSFDPPVEQFTYENEEMWGRPDMEEVPLEVEERESGHRVILRNFGRAILHGEELIAPGEVGLNSLELANAITLSSYTDRSVELPVDRAEFNELIEHLRATSKFREDWGASESETDPQHKV
ncbi:MAG: Gfo/Idh/MocA family protein [Planctomycetota bacterium]